MLVAGLDQEINKTLIVHKSIQIINVQNVDHFTIWEKEIAFQQDKILFAKLELVNVELENV